MINIFYFRLMLLAAVSATFKVCIGSPLLFADVTEIMWQNLLLRPPPPPPPPPPPSSSSSSNSTIFNLPDTTKPISYVLNITSISADTTNVLREFSGAVTVETISFNGTQQILLHCRNLRISSVKLLNARTHKELYVAYFLKPEDEILHIRILDAVSSSEPFRCKLTIEFSGRLNDQMMGFYRTWYKVGSQTRASDMVTDTFLTSPMMPTYLVAFAVFDFRSVDGTNKSIRAWARDSVIESTAHALSAVPKILHQMEEYTTIPYTLPKMDLLVVPNMDFPAMEHWGLLTFSEQYFLYDERINVQKELIQVICVVAHEIAHQWFGNYVTSDSWSYIWLNEGFARFFESKLTAEFEPSWRMNDYFVVEFVHRMLFEDGGANFHHPMTERIRTPNDVTNTFNMVTYDKGGSILRMLEHMVTSQVFQKTLQNYLKNSYDEGGTVNPSNLWKEFEVQLLTSNNALHWFNSNNLTDIMERWTTQIGYPLITVSKRQDDILLQQEMYDASHRSTWSKSSMPSPADPVWGVPISYMTKDSVNSDDTRPALILTTKEATLPVRLRSNDWILVNVQQTGYYRVCYDSRNWRLLTKQLFEEYSLIHPLNRAQLIDDSFSLAIDMKLSYTIPLSLSTYLRAETDVIPWIPAFRKMDFLFEQYQGTSIEDLLQKYASNLLTIQFDRVGFFAKKTDDHTLRMMRSWIAPYACKTGVELCTRAAKREYSKNIANLSRISNDIKEIVFCVALRNSEKADDVWNDLWHLYRNSNSAREKGIILRAIGCIPNVDYLRTYVRMLMNQDIRQEYHKHVIRALSSSANGVTAILANVRDKVKSITSPNPNELRMLTFLVKMVGERATTEQHLNIVYPLVACSLQQFREVISDAERILDRRYGVGALIKAVQQASQISKRRIERNRLVQDDIRNALQEIKNSGYDSNTVLRYLGCVIVLITWTCFL